MPHRYVHPFPARMAPQLALDALRDVRAGGIVLDPMCGSGTVLTAAMQHGLGAIGRDIDPLAVLMSRVATAASDPEQLRHAAEGTIAQARSLAGQGDLAFPTIDRDPRALAYVDYWFGPEQQRQLRALALALPPEGETSSDVLSLALSRTIVRKERGASLARDVSHSRPHRVADASTFDVLAAFTISVERILDAIGVPQGADVSVRQGDARDLHDVPSASVAAVMTSPPYLNAIDYIRGHRLALIWLGASLDALRRIRSSSIGAERAPDAEYDAERVSALLAGNGSAEALPPRFRNMFRRFASDMDSVLAETARVLEEDGRAVFVMGNSMIRGVFTDNAAVVSAAARAHGLQPAGRTERELPSANRYLPPPGSGASPLARRMRTEVVLTFRKSAA